MTYPMVTEFVAHLPGPSFHGDVGFHQELGEQAIHNGAEGFHQVIHERVGAIARGVLHAESGGESVDNEAAMAQGGKHGVSVIEHLVRRGIFLAVASGRRPPDGGEKQLPIAFCAVSLVDIPGAQCQIEMRAGDIATRQNVSLVRGFSFQESLPDASVQVTGAGDLIEKGFLIYYSR